MRGAVLVLLLRFVEPVVDTRAAAGTNRDVAARTAPHAARLVIWPGGPGGGGGLERFCPRLLLLLEAALPLLPRVDGFAHGPLTRRTGALRRLIRRRRCGRCRPLCLGDQVVDAQEV